MICCENIIKIVVILCLYGVFFLLGMYSSDYLNDMDKIGEKDSPQDWITQDKILVYENKVVINETNLSWASYSNTNSMDPVLDENANGLYKKINSEEELKVGDIISYVYGNSTIVHRIIFIGQDNFGWYCITKGDNNAKQDPEKIRPYDINSVLVAIIY